MIRGEYPPVLIEALAIHIFLESLGYSKKDNIFLIVTGKDVIVRLKADGKEGDLRAGSQELSDEAMGQKWLELIAEYNNGGTMTKEDKDGIFFNSKVRRYAVRTLVVLTNAGFNRWMRK